MRASPDQIAYYTRLARERGGTVGGKETIPSFDGISEKDFQVAVVKLASRNAWRVFHPYDMRRSCAGWPDLVCLRNGVMIVAELKVGKNRTSAAQDAWLEDFRELAKGCIRVEVFEWRPENWGEIEKVLAKVTIEG